jgi:hypothetical protein
MRNRKRLMRVQEAHRYLKDVHGLPVSEKTLRQWVFQRKVAITKIGGMLFIQVDSLDGMIRETPAV